VENQPVVGVAAKGLRDDLLELGFDRLDILARREAGAVAHPEDVGVDREGLFAERGVEHDVGGLAPDAGERLKLLARPRNLAAVAIDQCPAEGEDIVGLGVEQADGLDCIAKCGFAEVDHLFGRLDVLEQGTGGDIDAGVGRLGREHDGDQQLIGVG